MTVRRDGELIVLEGECRVEEAETLAAMLQSAGPAQAAVDWSRCTGLHGAVAQALLAFSPRLLGAPQNMFLREIVGLPFADDGAEGAPR